MSGKKQYYSPFGHGFTMKILDKTVKEIVHKVFDRLKSISENEIAEKRYQEKVKAAQLKRNKAKEDFAVRSGLLSENKHFFPLAWFYHSAMTPSGILQTGFFQLCPFLAISLTWSSLIFIPNPAPFNWLTYPFSYSKTLLSSR